MPVSLMAQRLGSFEQRAHLVFNLGIFLLADGEIAHHGDEGCAHGADDGSGAAAARRRVLARKLVEKFVDGALL